MTDRERRAHDLAIAYLICCYGAQYKNPETAKREIYTDTFTATYQDYCQTFFNYLGNFPYDSE